MPIRKSSGDFISKSSHKRTSSLTSGITKFSKESQFKFEAVTGNVWSIAFQENMKAIPPRFNSYLTSNTVKQPSDVYQMLSDQFDVFLTFSRSPTHIAVFIIPNHYPRLIMTA